MNHRTFVSFNGRPTEHLIRLSWNLWQRKSPVVEWDSFLCQRCFSISSPFFIFPLLTDKGKTKRNICSILNLDRCTCIQDKSKMAICSLFWVVNLIDFFVELNSVWTLNKNTTPLCNMSLNLKHFYETWNHCMCVLLWNCSFVSWTVYWKAGC